MRLMKWRLIGKSSVLVTRAFVRMTGFPRINNLILEKGIKDLPWFSGTTADHFDAPGLQDVDCARAHVSRKHHGDATLRQNGGDIRFAAASFLRADGLSILNDIIVIECKDKIRVALAKMTFYEVMFIHGHGYVFH